MSEFDRDDASRMEVYAGRLESEIDALKAEFEELSALYNEKHREADSLRVKLVNLVTYVESYCQSGLIENYVGDAYCLSDAVEDARQVLDSIRESKKDEK